jgi:hypothetical protein
MIKQDMGKVHDTRLPTGVKQWKQELELLRSEIGHQHDHLIERMRAGETSLLEALYSFAESSQGRVSGSERVAPSIQDRRATLEHRIGQIARRLNSPPG